MDAFKSDLLKGKKVLVTGSSRGIGAALAREVASCGAQVAITYSAQKAKADEVKNSLPGEGHLVVALDVSSPESVDAAFKTISSEFGNLDGLVNNAGITRDQLMMRMKLEDFDAVLNTNLRGAFLCMQAVMRPMLKARSGSIVNISSVVAQMGNPGQSNYSASKAGLEGLTRSLAMEVASRGIRVNAVAPGFIETDMTDELDEKQRAALMELIPLKRLGKVEDLTGIVAFLLSDRSTYITGQVLGVNGGLYM